MITVPFAPCINPTEQWRFLIVVLRIWRLSALLILLEHFNPDILKYQFYLYDPWMYAESTTIIRTYKWICNGQKAYYESHKDTGKWEWLVTYRIGPYDQHTKIVF